MVYHHWEYLKPMQEYKYWVEVKNFNQRLCFWLRWINLRQRGGAKIKTAGAKLKTAGYFTPLTIINQ
jgi:hypothetical protein